MESGIRFIRRQSGNWQSMGFPARGKERYRSPKQIMENMIIFWEWKILRIVGKDPEGKVKLLLDYSDNPRDIADPWYTGDFESTYRDVVEGCEGFLAYLEKNEKI